LEIATEDQAAPAADRLRDLVTDYGLPFARRFANSDALLDATTPVADEYRRFAARLTERLDALD
jgi:hypothetical protein